MIINEDTLRGKWTEIKGDVQKTWGKLTENEVTQTKGDIKALAGLVQQKYGEGWDAFEKKLSQILGEFKDKKETAVTDAKTKLRGK